MPWNITYHEKRPEHPTVGDMWPAPWLVKDNMPREFFLSDDFITNKRWEKRAPLIVRLPGGVDFCIDGPTFEKGARQGGGWIVSGQPPRITLSPSVNITGIYHGFIKDGIISEDVEGRQFLK